MRPIDADALKDKLQQHHDFYVMAWGGFGKMPIGEKKRVDEITNCIAEVVNAPTIEPKQGEWMPCSERLPRDLEVVNITWVNHRPVCYYSDIKDKPFTATAIHYKDKWWWYSPICEDLLAEYGKSECDKMDADIEVTAWMPLPKPYEEVKENE